MKLKLMLLGGLFLIPFFSCENREEVTFVQIDTELIAEIQVISEDFADPGLKSSTEVGEYLFTGTGIFCLAQNETLGKPLCSVENIKPKEGSKLIFTGVGSSENFLSLQLSWGFKNMGETTFQKQDQINISLLTATAKNGDIEFDLTSVINPLISCINCNPACLYQIEIQGETGSVVPEHARLVIPVSAEQKIYHVQFSLF